MNEKLHPRVQKLRHLRLSIMHLVKQAWLLPRFVVIAIKRWRRQIVLDEREAERLDRIRNPSKYLGRE